MPAGFRIIRSGVSALVLMFAGAVTDAAEPRTAPSTGHLPAGRLRVAILGFANETGDPEAAHWRCGIDALSSAELREIKAIKLSGGVEYARRQIGAGKSAILKPEQARKMGELIEAQRVVWGSYKRQNERWQVRAYVLNVASGKASDELIATSADWFELRDGLTQQILHELGVQPSGQERQKMGKRWTASSEALEWYSRACAYQDEDRPLAEQEDSARKAIGADPQFARAYLALAATLGMQGKFAQAEQAVSRALELEPESPGAHRVAGVELLFVGKHAEAERELREAHRLNPDDSRALIRLAELSTLRGEWDEAIAFAEKARFLEPTDASTHAFLGFMYTLKRGRDEAIVELKEAERLDPESLDAMQKVGQAYETICDIPSAIEHYKKFVIQAKKLGVDPGVLRVFEEKIGRLQATLTPTFIETPMPKVYTEQTLWETLRERLMEDELSMVVNPLVGSEEIKRWAEQLAEDADSDMEKAKALFDGLTRRIEPGDGRGHRTAKEVFAAWDDPNVSLSCTEYSNLFIALARAVNLKAFYVHVERDYRNKEVPHDCVALFVDEGALLVDATYRWFGVPHKEFVILDDLQAVAHHLVQLKDPDRELAQRRLAVKLHPDLAWTRFALMKSLCKAEQWDEAHRIFESVLELEPDDCEIYLWRGIFADHDGDLDTAADYLRKASALNPEDALAHLGLGEIFGRQGKLKKAREEFRACLRYVQDKNTAENARKMIAQINEQIGIEESPPPTSQSQADLNQEGKRSLSIR